MTNVGPSLPMPRGPPGAWSSHVGYCAQNNPGATSAVDLLTGERASHSQQTRPCRLTHRSCCRCYAYTVECRGPRHAHPQQGLRAARYCIGLIPLRKKIRSRRRRCCCEFFFLAVKGLFFLILSLLAQSTVRHQTKPVLICWGHAMHTPTRIAGHKAVVEFLPENLPFIYIDTNIIYYMIVNKTHVQIEKKKGK